ncbi:MAG: Hsp20/alpha crystallin family protein [Haloferacaceae archaeon]|jgi:HSP20 family protein
MDRPTDPFDELSRLFERMQSDFEEMARSWGDEPGLVSSSVRVDLEDRADELVLTAELPGFETDDIDVRVTDRTLHLEADHTTAAEETAEGEYLKRERRRTSVSRSVSLPEAVETDDISASFNNGVLTVRLPKSEPATQGEAIEIE